ncbi:hypothetical protein [uncultured Pontibacter sp.]|uniref:hypothetical protein n=1 Tax=uncultured Pontibacter sp. TaxID=453356 RepID=UPI00261ACDCA|nr:hypothetical protein [uncultured Pontibacter sp.]
MQSINRSILIYLLKNDNGDYLDVNNAFRKNVPVRHRIEDSLHELKEYIEKETSDAFIWNLDGPMFQQNESPLSRVRINQKGRDYLREIIDKETNLRYTKIGIAIAALGAIVALFSAIL